MKPFRFQIWDLHKTSAVSEDGELYWKILDDPKDDNPWKKFKFVLYSSITIDYFHETIIFQRDLPIRCTKVFLSDGSVVFAVWQADTFDEKYSENIAD